MTMALLPVEEARSRILSNVKPLPPENIQLAQALGRVLAKPLSAKRDQPPFDASAMDGYALRAVDTTDASAAVPIAMTRNPTLNRAAIRMLTPSAT